MYRFSQRLAWAAAVVLPLGETLRRWGSWWDFPPAYIDDLLIGAFFLVGAWMSRRADPGGARWLAAAYGCGLGIGLMSLATAITHIEQPDPSGVSGLTAVLVKSVLVGLGVAGLAGALVGPVVQRRS